MRHSVTLENTHDELARQDDVTPPRIVILATTLAGKDGGISRTVPRLARALAGVNARVTLIAPHTPKPAIAPSTLRGVRLLTATSRRELKSLIRRSTEPSGERLIAYHAGVWAPANHYFATAARSHGVPYISSPRGMLNPRALNHKPLRKKMAWAAYARNDIYNSRLIHVTSELEASHIKALNIPVPVSVIPHGIDVPLLPQELLCRRQTSRKKKLLFLSRLHPTKGIEDLLLTFDSVFKNDCELFVVGDGHPTYTRTLRRLASSMQCGESVFFCGEVSDQEKWLYFQLADVFVLPSYSENFGLAIAEALAAGVPVITTTATPWQDLPKYDSGWCVTPGRAPLTTAIRNALSLDAITLRRMGLNGRRWMIDCFSWERTAVKFLQACNHAIAEG